MGRDIENLYDNFMKDSKNLYRITTYRLGEFYVVASSFDDAAMALKKRLDDADYGFFSDRRIMGVECLAVEEWSYSDNSKQRFSDDTCNLVIASDASCDERILRSFIKE